MAAVARKQRQSSKVVSIQANSRKSSGKSHVARLNDKTKRHAYNTGKRWDDDDVNTLANMIAKDATTFDMALALGRTFYSAQSARAHVGFALRHARVLKRHM